MPISILDLLLIGIIFILCVFIIVYISRKGSTSPADQAELASLSRQISQLDLALNQKIDNNNARVQDSITRQLSESRHQMQASNRVISEISERLGSITETNKHVVSVADELKTLQAVLQNPKQRGVFGEYYLDTVLGNVLPPGSYNLQYKFKDGEIVDAVVYLDKGKILPIDSKFSLENYNRMVAANTKSERERYAKKVRDDLKARIDETSKYIRPAEQTMDFAFMFMPSESLYYDLLINKVGTAGASERDLIEYAFRDKRVIITSPTSFMAYLQTILQGLRSLEIEKDTREIQARIAKLGAHLSGFDNQMQKLGGALGTTVNHYNSAYKTLAQIDKDVVKITTGKQEARRVAAQSLDRPQLD